MPNFNSKNLPAEQNANSTRADFHSRNELVTLEQLCALVGRTPQSIAGGKAVRNPDSRNHATLPSGSTGCAVRSNISCAICPPVATALARDRR